VLHESVTRDAATTLRVLKAKGFGVHYIISPDGSIQRCAEDGRVVFHAGPLNARSIGVELVNPYYPNPKGQAPAPWNQVIKARWAHQGSYVVPTSNQMESLWSLLCFIRDQLRIPLLWPGVAHNRLSMTRIKDAFDMPGVQAHTYTAHADGAWPVLYSWLRDQGFDYNNAMNEALRLAQNSGLQINLSNLQVQPTQPKTQEVQP
jgi:hypothetical protein